MKTCVPPLGTTADSRPLILLNNLPRISPAALNLIGIEMGDHMQASSYPSVMITSIKAIWLIRKTVIALTSARL